MGYNVVSCYYLRLMNNEENKVIEEFLKYLDRQGYNFYVIQAIRNLLGKGVNYGKKESSFKAF